MTVSGTLHALFYTAAIWLVAAALSVLVGGLVAYLRMSRLLILRIPSAIYISVGRGIPPLAWMFVVFFGPSILGFSPGPVTAGIAALVIFYTPYMAEIYRSSIASVSRDLLPAASAVGLSTPQAMRLVVVPTALHLIVGEGSSIIINLLKETSLASLIGVTGLTFYANATVQSQGNSLTTFVVVGCVYLVLSAVVGVAARLGSLAANPRMRR